MSLLLDLTITPEVFGPMGYSTQDRCDPSLLHLQPILLEEAVVRNLAGGRWQEAILAHPEECSLVGQKLIAALAKQSRLRDFDAVQNENPESGDEWYYEALAAHEKEPADGILVGHVIDQRDGDDLVCGTERMHEAAWFRNRTCSVRLNRQSCDYSRQIDPLLKFATSAAFFDSHLDPILDRYAQFPDLLGSCCRRKTALRISIHTSGVRRVDGARVVWTERTTREHFDPVAKWLARSGAKAKVDVFVWEQFHDRYLITNLMGVSVPNGFDVDLETQESRTTWTRLSRQDSDDVIREFEPNNSVHRYMHFIELKR